MARYKVQNGYVTAGFIADAEDRIEEAIQPFLDGGTKDGWTLHSFQATAAAKAPISCSSGNCLTDAGA
jgi:hypothetical protein